MRNAHAFHRMHATAANDATFVISVCDLHVVSKLAAASTVYTSGLKCSGMHVIHLLTLGLKMRPKMTTDVSYNETRAAL